MCLAMGIAKMYFVDKHVFFAKVHIFKGSDVGRLCWDEFLGNYKSSFFKMICWSSPRTVGDRKLDLQKG